MLAKGPSNIDWIGPFAPGALQASNVRALIIKLTASPAIFRAQEMEEITSYVVNHL
jgi:hypothetical protein